MRVPGSTTATNVAVVSLLVITQQSLTWYMCSVSRIYGCSDCVRRQASLFVSLTTSTHLSFLASVIPARAVIIRAVITARSLRLPREADKWWWRGRRAFGARATE